MVQCLGRIIGFELEEKTKKLAVADDILSFLNRLMIKEF